MCFYFTQSDILLRGIARITRENKNKLRTFQPQKRKKIKNSQPQTNFTGCYKKRVQLTVVILISFVIYIRNNRDVIETILNTRQQKPAYSNILCSLK